LDISVLGYIGIVWPKEHSPEVWHIPPGTPCIYIYKVKFSHYRPCVAQRVCRGIALLLHDRDTRRGWVVSSTPRPHFTLGKDPVPILQEARWAPGPVWTGGKSRPQRDSIPDRPACSSVAIPTELPSPHTHTHTHIYIYIYRVLVGTPEEKRSLGKPRLRWEDNL